MRDARTAAGRLPRPHAKAAVVRDASGEEVARQLPQSVKGRQKPAEANAVLPEPSPDPRDSAFAWRDFLFVGDPALLARIRAALP